MCDVCEQRFHVNCFGLPVDTMNCLIETGYVLSCQSCIAGCKKLISTVKLLESKIEDLLMSTNDLRGRLEKVEQKEIDMQTNGSVNSAPKQSYADIVKHVSKVVEDHEGRRKNVIITGVKEEDKEVTKETIKDIFNGMAIDMQDDLFSVARLGQKKENGKPRRIIVRCCNEADRDKIMARKHNLKTIQNDLNGFTFTKI